MSTIEALAHNICVINQASAKFDFSVIDAKDALTIKNGIDYVKRLLQIYMDFENGFNPDADK